MSLLLLFERYRLIKAQKLYVCCTIDMAFVMIEYATTYLYLFDELIQSLNGRLIQGVLSLK